MGKVMLIADDLGECQEMINYINSNSDAQLVSAVDNVFIWSMKQKSLNEVDILSTQRKPENSEDLMSICSAKLDEIGMKPSLNGRKYLLDALLLLDEGNAKQRVSEMVATKYGKSEESVRGAMKRAIQTTWESMPDDILQENYTARLRPNKKAPTVMEFLHYFV